jgi:hypothetical protein
MLLVPDVSPFLATVQRVHEVGGAGKAEVRPTGLWSGRRVHTIARCEPRSWQAGPYRSQPIPT